MITASKILEYQFCNNILLLDNVCRCEGNKMKNLYWRNDVLWCTYPLPDYPKQFSLKIKCTGKEDRKVCETLAESVLSLLKTRHLEGRLFNYSTYKEKVKAGTLFEIFETDTKKEALYRPKFWRLVGRYWYNHLRYKKSGANDRYHLIHSLKKFGSRYADTIEPGDVTKWLKSMKTAAETNTINRRLSYMQAVFSYANDQEQNKAINYNPVRRIKKLKGGNVRSFLLTPEKFEANYSYLSEMAPKYALFYLALWSTGRRPMEVSLYTWDMYDIKQRGVNVPPSISKTDEYDFLPFSERLHDELMQSAKQTGLLFPNNLGNPWIYLTSDNKPRNNNYRYMKMLREKFGNSAVGVARDARRGFVTRKTSEGHKIENIMLNTGHTTYSTIKRYKIPDTQKKRDVIASDTPPSPKNVIAKPEADFPTNIIPFQKMAV